jgi:hypothetical protein
MERNHIIDEIKRTANENGGKPLGQERFARETGISIGSWRGKYWIKWSEALAEAGFESNKYIEAYSSEFLLEKLALLTRELMHFPVNAELKLKARADKNFPSHSVFDRLGQKNELIHKLSQFCISKNEFEDIIPILDTTNKSLKICAEQEEIKKSGYVYLVRHGARNEYKIGRTNNPIRREGELSIELPEKLAPIHWIETDDPSGIERYWHKRFALKRKNGEWFTLSTEDVRAFKRWKRIY